MAERKDDKAVLWVFNNKDKKSDKQPDFSGPGRIHKDVLKDFVEAYKEVGDGQTLELRCAGWTKQGKQGPYTFILIEPARPYNQQKAQEKDDDIPF